MDANVIKKLLVASINLNGLAIGIVDEVLEPALKKVVADSGNKVAAAIMAAIYPVLEEKIKEVINEHVDLAKILKIEE